MLFSAANFSFWKRKNTFSETKVFGVAGKTCLFRSPQTPYEETKGRPPGIGCLRRSLREHLRRSHRNMLKKSVDNVKKWWFCRLNNPKKRHHPNRSLFLISIDFLTFLFDDVMGILLFSGVCGFPINLFFEIISKSNTSKPIFPKNRNCEIE